MKIKNLQLLLTLITFSESFISASSVLNDSCASLSTCGECIRVPSCVWCSELNMKEDQVRCQSKALKINCSPDSIFDPVTSSVILEDQQFTNLTGQSETLTLRPQKISVKNLRIGEPFNVSLQFKAVQNYPADLYYLMDVSYSMNDDKTNLARLGGSLVSAMRNITSDFQLGFGSFVDKNVLPFVKSIIVDPNVPCGQPGTACLTYSFQNQLSLSTRFDEFTATVEKTPIVQTFDEPEGGFDALLQATVCKNKIGWRDKSRRLIVFATDAVSHLAGNGRLGGIIRPNDGQCHLDPQNGMYLEATSQDYPSLGQISQLVKNHSLNVIFAVTEKVQSGYQEFSRYISGSRVGTLDENSENIVELIHDIYQDIATSVELKDNAGNDVKIRYYTNCNQGQNHETNQCESLTIGDIVDFTISIEVSNCPINEADRKQVVQIYPVGVNEAVTLELEFICDCPCEKPGNPGYVGNATECNSGGDLQCGVCNCDSLHSGTKCECLADSTIVNPELSCKANSTADILCSDRGDCICGKCECNRRPNQSEVISGTYCECDNFSCPRVDEILCSGHGRCICGQCLCDSGYNGTACDCETSDEKCYPAGGGDICSGNGGCECGKCVCSLISQGTYCQDCPTCPSKCDEFQPCVQCKTFQTGPYMNNKLCETECNYPIIAENGLPVGGPNERYCSYVNGDNCTVEFYYGYDTDGSRKVRVNKNPSCPEGEPPVLAYSLGLLGVIVFLGLLALLGFRIYTYLYDKRECARFLEEQKKAKWNREGNPLYVDPFTTFRNPNYNS